MNELLYNKESDGVTREESNATFAGAVGERRI